jgi:hypothetical protein
MKMKPFSFPPIIGLACAGLLFVSVGCPPCLRAAGLWQEARTFAGIHRFSTLFCAQDVRDYLSGEEGLQRALAWCKETGVTKVYIESFRDGYRAERAAIERANQLFQAEGFDVCGCVTPTRIGKRSSGWGGVTSCYTDEATQTNVQAVFEYAASLFDEIMIDDFWFSNCLCAECDAARRARTVTIGERTYPVGGDRWEDYHCELMARMSRDRVLGPARRVNPKVRLIIKYPKWYDDFHERGYEVIRETADFDKIWVGTETRDYRDRNWGGTVQYEGYFIMRWLGGIGGTKCGGGWFDSLGTTEGTYIEQARQTVLGGARESMLYSYGSLQHDTGPKDIMALRTNLAGLLAVAQAVHERQPVGVAAYKPANSHPEDEQRVFDFAGMLGLPLVPCHEFPTNAPAAFFSVHALKDPQFAAELSDFVKAGKPVLLTDGLARRLGNRLNPRPPNVQILPVNGAPESLLELPRTKLDAIRGPLLRPLKTTFHAPNSVALYLFRDGGFVVENFNDAATDVEVNGQALTVEGRGWDCRISGD